MHRYPKLYPFIEDEHSQLEECPTVRASAFGFGAWQLVSSLPNTRTQTLLSRIMFPCGSMMSMKQ